MPSTLRHLAMPAVLCLLAAQGLRAHCGLTFCPRAEDVPDNAFEASVAAHQTGFDLNGHGGQYTEVAPNFTYLHKAQWLVSANLGLAGLDVKGATHWGLENPLLLAEYHFYPGMGNRITLGSELELPFGDHDHGIAANHYMLVPYAAYGRGLDPFFVSATVGFSTRVGPDHKNADSTVDDFLYVHPHEDRELLYRVGAGISLWNKKANPEVYLNGQHVLVADRELLRHDDDLTLGLVCPIALEKNLRLSPLVEIPLLSTDRFDWNAGAEMKFGF